MKNCSTCKYWDDSWMLVMRDVRDQVRSCHRVGFGAMFLRHRDQAAIGDVTLMTNANFSCSEWTKKDGK